MIFHEFSSQENLHEKPPPENRSWLLPVHICINFDVNIIFYLNIKSQKVCQSFYCFQSILNERRLIRKCWKQSSRRASVANWINSWIIKSQKNQSWEDYYRVKWLTTITQHMPIVAASHSHDHIIKFKLFCALLLKWLHSFFTHSCRVFHQFMSEQLLVHYFNHPITL